MWHGRLVDAGRIPGTRLSLALLSLCLSLYPDPTLCIHSTRGPSIHAVTSCSDILASRRQMPQPRRSVRISSYRRLPPGMVLRNDTQRNS